MSDYYTYADTVKIANNIKNNVEKSFKLGENTQWSYFIARQIIKPKNNVQKWYIKPAPSPKGDNISRQILKKDYMDMANRLVKYCDNNKVLPNYITVNGLKMKVNDYTYMFARILVYYDKNKAYPNYAEANSQAFTKPTQNTDTVYDYFTKVFGKVSTIDDALAKISGRGYGYYYDDKYSNKQSIDRMKNKQGVNCTDSSQVFYHIGKALGYDVKSVHIKCKGGDGHIRLQFRHSKNTGGKWINRDPASVLNGNGVTSNWCLNGTVLGYDPNWFKQNLNR